ncbi:hypothetical protein DCS32_06815 [Dokdonia sp. Dokd-P16]|uniref:hypothetical protein n=1 Tax=Dokdonia sp. Dokd-P16 TaxID=2173169 RepID=UPI000D54563A|nr:hypothetical protein [Dokdonia sp. Dokd-P16]AWH73875.1 hypothetical protein DCS32_06815 [Dokdonia sp. Dokd-P16]
MKFLPSKRKRFCLVNSQVETVDRLIRRTKKSDWLISTSTEKSFIGEINGNKFRLISSKIGRGAFCKLTGEVNTTSGFVDVEIHKAFKILLSLLYLLPVIGITTFLMKDEKEFSTLMAVSFISQILIIRFIAIPLTFHRNLKDSLNRLRDVLDIEWTEH